MDMLNSKIFVLLISRPVKAENIYKAYVFASVVSSHVVLRIVFTGTIKDRFLTNQSTRSMSV